MDKDSEAIIATIEQIQQQTLETLKNLDTEKRTIIAEYIKSLEEQKIAEIKQLLQELSNNH